jgi:hypothetical protein
MEDQPLAGKERQLDHALLVAEYHARMDAFLRDETRSAMTLVLPRYELLEYRVLIAWLTQCPRDLCHSITVLSPTGRLAHQASQLARQEFARLNRVMRRLDTAGGLVEFEGAPCIRFRAVIAPHFTRGINGVIIVTETALEALTDDQIQQFALHKTVFCARSRHAIERCERLGVQPCYVDMGG